MDEKTGYSDADDEVEAVADAMTEIEEKIIGLRATTIFGLQARAMVLKRYGRDDDEEYINTRALRAMPRSRGDGRSIGVIGTRAAASAALQRFHSNATPIRVFFVQTIRQLRVTRSVVVISLNRSGISAAFGTSIAAPSAETLSTRQLVLDPSPQM